MNNNIIDHYQIGDEIPSLITKPISRSMLALYAGASGDHNPIHIDIDFYMCMCATTYTPNLYIYIYIYVCMALLSNCERHVRKQTGQ